MELNKQTALYFAKLSEAAYSNNYAEFNFKNVKTFSGFDDIFGYVATTQDNDVILSFRGTADIMNWLADLSFGQAKWIDGDVHDGFLDSFLSVLPQIEYLKDNPKLYITGHSLGGALAALATKYLNPVATFTFGQPRVGNKEFAKNFKNKNYYRLINKGDWIPDVPPILSLLWQYEHFADSYHIINGKIKKTGFWSILTDNLTTDLLIDGVKKHYLTSYIEELNL